MFKRVLLVDRNDFNLKVVLLVGFQTKQRIEDALALYIQRIIAGARSRGVKPRDEVSALDAIYGGEDDLNRTFHPM